MVGRHPSWPAFLYIRLLLLRLQRRWYAVNEKRTLYNSRGGKDFDLKEGDAAIIPRKVDVHVAAGERSGTPMIHGHVCNSGDSSVGAAKRVVIRHGRVITHPHLMVPEPTRVANAIVHTIVYHNAGYRGETPQVQLEERVELELRHLAGRRSRVITPPLKYCRIIEAVNALHGRTKLHCIVGRSKGRTCHCQLWGRTINVHKVRSILVNQSVLISVASQLRTIRLVDC